MTSTTKQTTGGSQTLARGLHALALIGESNTPLTVPEVAEQLGIHRSMAYRLVRTLQDFGFVERDPTGRLEIGVRMATLTRSIARDLQAAASPELVALANSLGMTAFIVAYDGEQAVTLLAVEPQNAVTTVAQRPGSRHPIDHGAPGRVIRSQLKPDAFPAKRYEFSQDEVFSGLSSIAVPLRTADERPASLAILYVMSDLDVEEVANKLEESAGRIESLLTTH
ncbi:IclR family transcriptional regulator [Enteractinococcus helveticum]|uniref:ArsR family transcriptional regulator n=1 Tax=Enteractinococcus helveticum TaxID=1837282 RepID=A0A1B7M0P4_9MICC|nr:helix-turn-helix domain-containing protein [Enteractinococcus helveticum]OAV61826.1 ArsR family transcriptional regulator [Enteractinococcus helveticum]